MESIIDMNTTGKCKNIISTIEAFIDKRKEHLSNCLGPNNTPSLPFEFPPGHKIRIQKFVTELQKSPFCVRVRGWFV